MTNEEIDKLEAGRELDALVAEKVMGWICSCNKPTQDPDRSNPYGIPGFCKIHSRDARAWSISISAAWDVVEKLKREYEFNLDWDIRIGWNCALGFPETEMKACVSACADTAPLVICRAALKAVNNG